MKAIPKTTNEQILKYNTAFEICHCPDFESRGGSYIDPVNGDRVCKHMAHYRANVRYAEEQNIMIEVRAFEVKQAQQEQAAKAQAAINRLYGPSVQVVAPTKSLLEWADFLEIDAPAAPARKEPTAEELFARFQ